VVPGHRYGVSLDLPEKLGVGLAADCPLPNGDVNDLKRIAGPSLHLCVKVVHLSVPNIGLSLRMWCRGPGEDESAK
jgi:hypothetical protein